MKAFIDAANQSQRTDPVPNRADVAGYQSARWNAAVPEALRYDPVRNPRGRAANGLRCGAKCLRQESRNRSRPASVRQRRRPVRAERAQRRRDHRKAVPRPQREDRRLRSGRQLRRRRARVGDAGAIKRTYQSGLMLGANGGLTSIPIFDNATSNETGGYHYGWFHFALRERLRRATGGKSDNMVMWRSVEAAAAKRAFDQWMVGLQVRRIERPAADQGPPGAPEGSRRRLLRQVHAACVHHRRAAVHQQAGFEVQRALSGVLQSRERKPAARWPPTSSSAS